MMKLQYDLYYIKHQGASLDFEILVRTISVVLGVMGMTFLFLLRDKPGGKDVPVIVISGLEDEGSMRRAKELGVVEYLVKSKYKTDELLGLVRKYCAREELAAGS